MNTQVKKHHITINNDKTQTSNTMKTTQTKYYKNIKEQNCEFIQFPIPCTIQSPDIQQLFYKQKNKKTQKQIQLGKRKRIKTKQNQAQIIQIQQKQKNINDFRAVTENNQYEIFSFSNLINVKNDDKQKQYNHQSIQYHLLNQHNKKNIHFEVECKNIVIGEGERLNQVKRNVIDQNNKKNRMVVNINGSVILGPEMKGEIHISSTPMKIRELNVNKKRHSLYLPKVTFNSNANNHANGYLQQSFHVQNSIIYIDNHKSKHQPSTFYQNNEQRFQNSPYQPGIFDFSDVKNSYTVQSITETLTKLQKEFSFSTEQGKYSNKYKDYMNRKLYTRQEDDKEASENEGNKTTTKGSQGENVFLQISQPQNFKDLAVVKSSFCSLVINQGEQRQIDHAKTLYEKQNNLSSKKDEQLHEPEILEQQQFQILFEQISALNDQYKWLLDEQRFLITQKNQQIQYLLFELNRKITQMEKLKLLSFERFNEIRLLKENIIKMAKIVMLRKLNQNARELQSIQSEQQNSQSDTLSFSKFN